MPNRFPRRLVHLFAVAAVALTALPAKSAFAADPKPLQVLLVAGGCCHDYKAQTKILKEGIEARINAEVTVVLSPSTSTETRFEIYESDDWAKKYDVVLHDECSASVTDQPYVTRILKAHADGVPAVNLHCAMHSYRWGNFRAAVEDGADNAGWYEMLGLQSTGHGPKFPIDVSYADSKNPIAHDMQDWTTVNEELYNNIRVFSGAEVIASGKQAVPPREKDLEKNPEAKPRVSEAVVAWTNLYGPNKTRIFSTTLGHFNETVADDRYLELVCRGLLWTTDNISADGSAAEGYGK